MSIVAQGRRRKKSCSVFNAFGECENPVGKRRDRRERFFRLLAMRRVADAGITSVSTGQ